MTEQTNAKELEDYYEIGSSDNVVISASSLKYINPDEGGSPRKFQAFLDNKLEKKQSKAIEVGNYIHKFLESPEEFIVSDIAMPSEMGARWAQETYRLAKESGVDFESVADEWILGKFCVTAKTNVKAYSNIKDTAKIQTKFKEECLPYMYFLAKAEDKIAMTPDQKKTFDGVSNSLQASKTLSLALFGQPAGEEIHNEKVIIWKGVVADITLTYKAKIDKIIIDHQEKAIHIIDFKTTGKPLSLYKWSFREARVYRQLAMYARAVRKEFTNLIAEGYTVGGSIVVAETSDFFECAPFEVSNDWILRGDREITELSGRIAHHIQTGNWSDCYEMQINNGFMSLPKPEELIR